MFNQEICYLGLDFDGVIVDSIAECLVLGHNAFVEFSGKGRKVYALKELEPRSLAEAKRLRNFIRSGEDYVYINLALRERAEIHDQETFDAFKQRYSQHKPDFFRLFYTEREKLSSGQRDLWLSLLPLYKGIRDFLYDYRNKEDLYIISTRKADYMAQILSGNGIQINRSHLFFADDKRNKRTIISELLIENDLTPDRFYFLDDQIDNLLKTAPTGINCLMAEWGYHNEDQLAKARKEGFRILTLPEFSSEFSK